MTMDQLRTRLVEIGTRRGLRALALRAGVSYDTVLNIRDGVTPSPRILTVEAIERAMKHEPRRRVAGLGPLSNK